MQAIAAPAPVSVFLRLFWALGGHAIIYLSLATSAMHRVRFPSVLDAITWITVVLMLVARRTDIVRYGGRTFDGDLATLVHFRRYAVALCLVTATASTLAHVLA